jgi:hypothetical protein
MTKKQIRKRSELGVAWSPAASKPSQSDVRRVVESACGDNLPKIEPPIAPKPPIARGDNIRDYFVAMLGRPDDDKRFDEMADLPCDSECGHHCALAIDAARTLLRHARYASGNHSLEMESIREVTKTIVYIYYFG